jgi:hypothetical protein
MGRELHGRCKKGFFLVMQQQYCYKHEKGVYECM